MSSITLSHLTVDFGDGAKGLDDVSLDVDSNEFIALVGPSGSGKTTLLRSIAGFLEPTSGTISIDGKDISNTPPERRCMGMVFQQHAVWPHMSVADNVAYPLKMAKVGHADRSARVHRALELVGLSDFGRRKPVSLSGGQRQRVALARAIVADPTVLLLDEALSALDEPLRDSLRRELVSLTRREGLTTVHVTHDRAEALAIADRIVVLDKGRIQQVATPQKLLARPASPQVAAFIADATILDAHRDAHEVICSSFGLSWPAPDSADISCVGVLPSHVELTAPGTPGAVDAIVTSALFEYNRFSVTAQVGADTTFRASTTTRPDVGDTVGLRISTPLMY